MQELKVVQLERLDEDTLQEVVILSKLMKNKKPIRKIKPFVKMKYGEVLELKSMAKQGIDEAMIQRVFKLSGHKKVTIENKPITAFFTTINEIENQFKYLRELESKLQTDVDNDLVASGIDELNVFGDLNVIDALAGGDILKWEKVLELSYEDVYNKLLKNKKENDIKRNLELIRKSKEQ